MKSAKRYVFLFVILPCLLVIPTLVLMMFSMRWDRSPKSTQLKSDLNALASAFVLYESNHNDYPPEQDWQSALLPHRAKGRPLTDPWGDPYIYETDTVDGVTTIKLFSANSDPDDPDQIITLSYEAEE